MKDFSDKKVLIFSDTHLTCKFNKKWFEEIFPLIKKADVVIINGDFWENVTCDFEDFIKSKWKIHLFPLLKDKAILIHGNHDALKYVKNPDKLRLFSLENKQEFEFIINRKVFHLEHGHILAWKYGGWWGNIVKFFKKKFKRLYSSLKQSEYLGYFLDQIGNKVISIYRESVKDDKNKFFIFGHIHKVKHDFDDNFIVIGSFLRNKKRYIEINNGEFVFVDEIY